jgi:hypothetical protein
VLRNIYSCDICGDEKPVADLVGLRFRNMREFQIDGPRTTDGKHLCIDCLIQIRYGRLPDSVDRKKVAAAMPSETESV